MSSARAQRVTLGFKPLTGPRMDKGELFMHPVNRAQVPDYYDVIKSPMSWLQIEEKLDKNAYREVGDFKVRTRGTRV